MKLRKLAAVLLTGVVMSAALTGCGSGSSVSDNSSGGSESGRDKSSSQQTQSQGDAQSSSAPDNSKGNDSMENVKLLGRAYKADDGKLWMGLSGTGAELEFTGSKLSVTLKGSTDITDKTARVGVFVDGQLTSDVCVDENEQTVDISGKDSEAVSVKIVKLSECASSCCAITALDAHGGQIQKAADKQHKIEFIGDSITCGYGVDDADLSHGFATATEDCTKAYAYKTAQALDADYSLVSYSGYGIVSGYTPTGEKNAGELVPPYYEYYGYCANGGFGSADPSKTAWDFSAFTPDVIVIYLGTNDSSYAAGDEAKMQEYSQKYTEFLKQVRAKNAGAKMICTLGTMGTSMVEPMKAAVSDYSQQTGDSNITTLELPVQDTAADGMVVHGHPTAATYDKAAALLTEKIKTEMGW